LLLSLQTATKYSFLIKIAYGGAQPIAKQSVRLPTVRELEILRDHVLSELKLGKQAPGYKTAQKALNRFISELIGSV
jgi:hypothetical protein